MQYVSITEAVHLLGISRQRVQQLLYAGRIEGAFKKERFWYIPLYNDMPRISKGTRGRQGTWRKRPQIAATYIHVNKEAILKNKRNTIKEPVINIRHGSKTTYCDKVDIYGHCSVIYAHGKKKNCGAKAWIELAPDARFVAHQFHTVLPDSETTPACDLDSQLNPSLYQLMLILRLSGLRESDLTNLTRVC